MKKWALLLAGVAAVVLIWVVAKANIRVTPDHMKPKFGLIDRGDIRVPIASSGLIEPKQRIEVKSKASGEVIEVKVAAGDFVREGDLLVRLKRDDEERSVSRAQADLERMEALYEQSKLAVDRANANVTSAEAALDELNAQLELAQFDYDRAKRREASGSASDRELLGYDVQLRTIQANIKKGKATLDSAKIAIDDAHQAVKTNAANVQVAKTSLADAEERLEETTVVARQDALVTEVNVTVGEVIQGGTSTFTGGTVICRLADISELKVVARVDEADYGRVMAITPVDALPNMGELRKTEELSAEEIETRSGKVRITVDAFPEEEFTGSIRRVEPQGRLNTGSSVIQYDVHVQITDDRRHKLLLGSQAQVEFTVESALGVLRVPAEAVMTNAERRGLWIKVPPLPGSEEQWGRKFIPVSFGITDGTYTEVVRSLIDDKVEDGMTVYTKLPLTPGGQNQ